MSPPRLFPSRRRLSPRTHMKKRKYQKLSDHTPDENAVHFENPDESLSSTTGASFESSESEEQISSFVSSAFHEADLAMAEMMELLKLIDSKHDFSSDTPTTQSTTPTTT